MVNVLANDILREKRKSICLSCEFLIDNSDEDIKPKSGCLACLMFAAFKKQCSVCGCYILPKAMLSNSECPKGKW